MEFLRSTAEVLRSGVAPAGWHFCGAQLLKRAAGVFLHVRGEHAHTLLDEQLDSGQTDARRCSGDDGHLPVETI